MCHAGSESLLLSFLVVKYTYSISRRILLSNAAKFSFSTGLRAYPLSGIEKRYDRIYIAPDGILALWPFTC